MKKCILYSNALQNSSYTAYDYNCCSFDTCISRPSSMAKTLITIAGPTAIGKTSMAISLAENWACPIISADSRQVYRELNIGVAKPSSDELKRAEHHLIGHVSIQELYSAGRFEREAMAVIDEIFKTHDLAILCGGSGLYIKALLEGLNEFPDVNIAIVSSLEAELKSNGIEVLQKELKDKDPDYFSQADTSNPRRVIRALSIIRQTGQKFSSFWKENFDDRHFDQINIELTMDRSQLYDRINKRVDLMMKAGLLEEVRELHAYKSLPSLDTVGYRELFEVLDNQIDLTDAIELIKRNTRRYAKRQMTWLRNQQNFVSFPSDDLETIIQFIDDKLRFNL